MSAVCLMLKKDVKTEDLVEIRSTLFSPLLLHLKLSTCIFNTFSKFDVLTGFDVFRRKKVG